MARPMHVGHMANHVCDTWHAMCQHHGTFESYKYGSSNSVHGGLARRRRRKGKEKGRKRKEKERRKEKKKNEEERKKKEEKEGVWRSEQTQTAKNSELRYKG